MRHGDDDIAFLVTAFDVVVRLGDLFERVSSVDDRSEHARSIELPDDLEGFAFFHRHPEHDPLVGEQARPGGEQVVPQPRHGQKISTARVEYAFAA